MGAPPADIRQLVRSFRAIGQAVLSTIPLNEALGQILEAIVPLLPETRSSIMLLEPNRRELITVATWGLTERETRIRFHLGEGVAGWAAAEGKTAVVDDPATDPRFVRRPDQSVTIKSLLSVPLFTLGQIAGVLNVHSETRAFAPEDVDLAELLATLISAEIQRHRLEQIALTDSLTGLGNRRAFDAALPREVARARRYAHPLTLMAFDLDGMKQVNDRLGHPAGDALLRHVGRLVRSMARQPDVFCRTGGDEFLGILPETGREGAVSLAERLRAAVGAWSPDPPVAGIRVSGSFGVAELAAGDGPEALVGRADAALYEAKHAGGDRIVGH